MEQNGAEKQPSLSDKQLAALPYLVSPKSLSEAARLANVGRTTLYRWMNDPDFREELERRRQEAAELADTELKGLRLKALIVFAESMEDPDPYVRVRSPSTSGTPGTHPAHKRCTPESRTKAGLGTRSDDRPGKSSTTSRTGGARTTGSKGAPINQPTPALSPL